MAVFTREELKHILNGKVVCEGKSSRFRDVSIDSRDLKKGDIFIAIQGASHDGHDFLAKAVSKGAAALIVSKKPGVTHKNVFVLRVDDTTRALGRLAQAHRMRFCIPVIAVTGSAGKTTTKELIAAVLKPRYRVLKNKGSLNNQWGVPLTLLKLSKRYDVAVIELGTNHPGEIAMLSAVARPTIAVLTNIGASHLEGLKNVRNVFQEKRSVVDYLGSGGSFVFNADDPFLVNLKRLKQNKISYGIERASDVAACDIKINQRAEVCFKINGRHAVCLKTPVIENISNALAAVACARLMRVPFKQIRLGLESVRFGNHRQQVERFKGYTLINDSYNSNPISLSSACRTLANFPVRGKRILVCGDMLELGKRSKQLHQDAGSMVSALNIDGVFAFGPMMKIFTDRLKQANTIRTVIFCSTITRLNQEVMKYFQRGDVVLIKGSRGMHMERVGEFLKAYIL